MKKKRVFLIIILVFLIFIVAGFIYCKYFLTETFFPPQVEKQEFSLDFLKNTTYRILCDFKLSNGIASGNDYFSVCKECIGACPMVDFEVALEQDFTVFSDLNKDGKEEAIVALSKRVGNIGPLFFLIAIAESGEQTRAVLLGENIKIESLIVEDGIINISLLTHRDSDPLCCPGKKETRQYKLSGNILEEIKKIDWENFRSVEFGFEAQYPKNWKIDKIDSASFRIYDPSALYYSFPIIIEVVENRKTDEDQRELVSYTSKRGRTFKISAHKETPYRAIFEKIVSSFKPNEVFVFDDFTTIKKDLLKEDVFLEIDAEDMKINLYKNGKKEKEFSVLTKGDYTVWGGAAAGLNDVVSKQTTAFSNISRVYMPYAIRYYGSYLVHGEPYYPSGAKVASFFSGGCFRVKDAEMKIIFDALEQGDPILIIDKKNDSYAYKDKAIMPFPLISAESYLIADLDSGFVIAEKNIRKEHHIDSIVKLMTALIITENTDIQKRLTVRPYMIQGRGPAQGLITGASYRMVDLFKPVLIGSSDYASWVLAHYFGRDETLAMMNKKTSQIMMPSTIFTDPSGFDEGNVSTAEDLFYLARYVKNNTLPLLKISKEKQAPLINLALFPGIENQNIFHKHPLFVGGKSGGWNTGLYIFNISERNIAFVVLGAETREKMEQDILKTIDWIQENLF